MGERPQLGTVAAGPVPHPTSPHFVFASKVGDLARGRAKQGVDSKCRVVNRGRGRAGSTEEPLVSAHPLGAAPETHPGRLHDTYFREYCGHSTAFH